MLRPEALSEIISQASHSTPLFKISHSKCTLINVNYRKILKVNLPHKWLGQEWVSSRAIDNRVCLYYLCCYDLASFLGLHHSFHTFLATLSCGGALGTRLAMILEEETEVPEQQCNTNTALQTQVQRISTTHFMFSFASFVTPMYIHSNFLYLFTGDIQSASFPCSSGNSERPGNEARVRTVDCCCCLVRYGSTSVCIQFSFVSCLPTR